MVDLTISPLFVFFPCQFWAKPHALSFLRVSPEQKNNKTDEMTTRAGSLNRTVSLCSEVFSGVKHVSCLIAKTVRCFQGGPPITFVALERGEPIPPLR